MRRSAKFCDDLLTFKEVAAELGVSVRTFLRIRNANKIKIIMLHKSKRIHRRDLPKCVTKPQTQE